MLKIEVSALNGRFKILVSDHQMALVSFTGALPIHVGIQVQIQFQIILILLSKVGKLQYKFWKSKCQEITVKCWGGIFIQILIQSGRMFSKTAHPIQKILKVVYGKCSDLGKQTIFVAWQMTGIPVKTGTCRFSEFFKEYHFQLTLRGNF